jgi:hypothetical protein
MMKMMDSKRAQAPHDGRATAGGVEVGVTHGCGSGIKTSSSSSSSSSFLRVEAPKPHRLRPTILVMATTIMMIWLMLLALWHGTHNTNATINIAARSLCRGVYDRWSGACNGCAGVYGTKGTFAATNQPGGIYIPRRTGITLRSPVLLI